MRPEVPMITLKGRRRAGGTRGRACSDGPRLPMRNKIDGMLAAVMATTEVINATGEDLLWRGVFLQKFPHDLLWGRLWPLVAFSLWHLVPQMILPSRLGRWRLVLGAGLVDSVSAFSALGEAEASATAWFLTWRQIHAE